MPLAFRICVRFLVFTLACCAMMTPGTGNTLAAAMPRKYRVATGSTIKISIPGARRLRINRDGIIHARRSDDGQWLVTGLAKGVVLAQAEKDPGTGHAVERDAGRDDAQDIVVEVYSPPGRSLASGRAYSPPGGANPLYGCDGLVHAVDAVRFKIVMDSTQSSSAGGLVPSIHVEGQLGRIAGHGIAGGNAAMELARGVATMASADKDGKVRARVLAEPKLALFPGSEAMARSGGEFRLDAPAWTWSPGPSGRQPGSNGSASSPAWDEASGWKAYGLALRASWISCQEGRAAVDYEVWLTQRVSGSEDHLLTGRISGKRLLSPDQFAFGGSIDFALDADSSSGSWWISRMPLVGDFLGQLLSRKGEEKGKSQMSVWLGLVPAGSALSELEVQSQGGGAAFEPVE